jgi:hypothetical protein
VRTSDECQQVAIDAGHSFDCLGYTFPTFWSARHRYCKSNAPASHTRAKGAYLNSSASSPHKDFIFWTARIGIMTTSPFCILLFYQDHWQDAARHKKRRSTCLNSCLLTPCRSITGSLNGTTTSSLATRSVFEIGAWRRRTSRIT